MKLFYNIENIIINLFATQIKDFTSSQKDNINKIESELINEFKKKYNQRQKE